MLLRAALLSFLSLSQAIYVPKQHELSHVPLDPVHEIKKRNFDQSLRISVFYDASIDDLDSAKKNLIQQQLLPDAKNFWSGSLNVKQTTSPILLNRDCVTATRVYYVANQPRHCERRLARTGCKSTTTCGTVQVQSSHLQACYSCLLDGSGCEKETGSVAGSGVSNSDYVLYVSSIQTSDCGASSSESASGAENVAYAGHCQLDQATDRPIFGFVNLCPDRLSTSPDSYDQQLATVKHEILHALGFSVALYAFFRDENGNPRTARNDDNIPTKYDSDGSYYLWNSSSTITTITRPDWQTRSGTTNHDVNIVVTPKVKELARKHFNCAQLEGLELENQGGALTALSHWEKRLLENEAMTGTFTQNPVFSELTFALLEDSGWYKPDYSKAERLNWGRNAGCDFAINSCGALINSNSPEPFCATVKVQPFRLRCTVDRLAVALCNMIPYTANLPPEYQYFSSINNVPSSQLGLYGGSVQLADYCPYNQEFTWTSSGVAVRGTRCRLADNNLESNYALETYGSESMCIEQGSAWKRSRTTNGQEQTVTAVNWGSGCYKIKCNAANSAFDIIFSNCTKYSCKTEGETIQASLTEGEWSYTGSLVCPSYESVCWDSRLQDTVSGGDCPDGGAEDTRFRVSSLIVILIVYCFI